MDLIQEAIPIADYKIKILTSSGISGVFDVKPYLGGSAFMELSMSRIFGLFALHTMASDGQTSKTLAQIQSYSIYKIPKSLQETLTSYVPEPKLVNETGDGNRLL